MMDVWVLPASLRERRERMPVVKTTRVRLSKAGVQWDLTHVVNEWGWEAHECCCYLKWCSVGHRTQCRLRENNVGLGRNNKYRCLILVNGMTSVRPTLCNTVNLKHKTFILKSCKRRVEERKLLQTRQQWLQRGTREHIRLSSSSCGASLPGRTRQQTTDSNLCWEIVLFIW